VWMLPIFSRSTRAILHKGREHGEEIRQAATHFQFDVLIHPSTVDSEGVILTLQNLRGVSAA